MKRLIVLILALVLLAPALGSSSVFAQHRHRKAEYMIGGGAAGAVIGGLAGGGKGALVGAGAGVAGGYLAHKYIHRRHRRHYAYTRRTQASHRHYYYNNDRAHH